MSYQERKVTSKIGMVQLEGDVLSVGKPAPDVALIRNDASTARLLADKGKTRVILSVPSLDTPVCDREARRFNQEAAGLGDKVRVIAVSMDLPFAQKRWCGAAGVDHVETLSDHKAAAFGRAFGVFIPGSRLLARAVFIVDGKGVLRYIQLVEEIGKEPDYNEVLKALKKIKA